MAVVERTPAGVRVTVRGFVRFARAAGFFLLAVFFSLVLGRLLWTGWSYLTMASSWVRIVLWLFAFVLTLLACGFWYRRLWQGQPLSGTGWFAGPELAPTADIAVTTLAVWFLLTGPFAFGTYLADRDRLLAALEPSGNTRDAYDKATEEYAWQAADVVPFIKATDTLNWTEPSRQWKQPAHTRATRPRADDAGQATAGGYSDTTGVLLVIYKILVLAPVLAAAGLAWRTRHESADDVAAGLLTHDHSGGNIRGERA